MKKNEFIHLHQLVYELAKHDLQNVRDRDEDPEDFFTEYDELGVGPESVNVSKSEQKEALWTLLDKYTEDIEMEKIRREGEKYSQKGLERMEAAEKIAEEVSYSPRTVYDKFSDVDVSFGNEHGKDTRQKALNQIERLKSEYKRDEVLERVSEENDVPRGTLKTWMSNEGITFEPRYSAILTDESKRELIETAEHYFDTRRNLDVMEEALDKDKATLRAYKKGDIDSVPVDLLEKLDSLFDSAPRYRMDDPDRYIEDENWRGVEVHDDFQEFLFDHLTTEEFTEMTGKSEGSFNKYRQNKTETIDREAYRKAFQAVSFMYSKNPDPEIDAVVDKNKYGTSGGDLEEAEIDMDITEALTG